MAREFIGAFDVGDVPGDDATDEEIDAWAEAMADALFDSPEIKKLNKK